MMKASKRTKLVMILACLRNFTASTCQTLDKPALFQRTIQEESWCHICHGYYQSYIKLKVKVFHTH